jgi:hypothetical protein
MAATGLGEGVGWRADGMVDIIIYIPFRCIKQNHMYYGGITLNLCTLPTTSVD